MWDEDGIGKVNTQLETFGEALQVKESKHKIECQGLNIK